jgi:hypothetical protein
MPTIPLRVERTYTTGNGPVIVAWAAVNDQGAVTSGVTVAGRDFPVAQARALTTLLDAAADGATFLAGKVATLTG